MTEKSKAFSDSYIAIALYTGIDSTHIYFLTVLKTLSVRSINYMISNELSTVITMYYPHIFFELGSVQAITRHLTRITLLKSKI
jgi:hypothetical protein